MKAAATFLCGVALAMACAAKVILDSTDEKLDTTTTSPDTDVVKTYLGSGGIPGVFSVLLTLITAISSFYNTVQTSRVSKENGELKQKLETQNEALEEAKKEKRELAKKTEERETELATVKKENAALTDTVAALKERNVQLEAECSAFRTVALSRRSTKNKKSTEKKMEVESREREQIPNPGPEKEDGPASSG